jgi:hypothetical protein
MEFAAGGRRGLFGRGRRRPLRSGAVAETRGANCSGRHGVFERAFQRRDLVVDNSAGDVVASGLLQRLQSDRWNGRSGGGRRVLASLAIAISAILSGNTILAAGALAGFLVFNFSPATIFLGDSGSLLIGFLLGCFGILGLEKHATPAALSVPMIALALPLGDAALTVVRRAMSRRPIFVADLGHIHHRLLDRVRVREKRHCCSMFSAGLRERSRLPPVLRTVRRYRYCWPDCSARAALRGAGRSGSCAGHGVRRRCRGRHCRCGWIRHGDADFGRCAVAGGGAAGDSAESAECPAGRLAGYHRRSGIIRVISITNLFS